MRILIVSQYFWPENFRINDLAKAYIDKGHQVTVLTGLPNYPEGITNPSFKKNPKIFSIYHGISIIRVPIIPRGNKRWSLILNYISFALTASTYGVYKLRKQTFDIIFVYQLSPITVVLPGMVLRRIKKVPMAMWILDLWPETLKAMGIIKSEKCLAIIRYFTNWIYNHCDLILVQSKSFISQIKSSIPHHPNIAYFPAWVDDEFKQPFKVENESISSDIFTIMFAGNIGEAQDFPAILSTVEHLKNKKNIRWVIVGEGRQAAWVKDQIKQRNLTENIIMVGRHPIEKMPEFFSQADVMLVSLKDEPIFSMTIPGKVQAYLGAGKPILAMLNGEGADIIIKAQAGFVSPAGDSKALAENVLSLMNLSKSSLNKMGDNGRRFSETYFNKNKLLTDLEQHFYSLLR
jgi:glycosyltransferase involved in cell wall biosynthesis